MLVRRLVLVLALGAVLAGSTVGVSAAGGFKLLATIPAVPPVLNVPLPTVCQIHLETDFTEFICTATAPNPDPPKDTKTVKFQPQDASPGSCKLTAYPDGGVVGTCASKVRSSARSGAPAALFSRSARDEHPRHT